MLSRLRLATAPALRLWIAGFLALVLASAAMAHRAAPAPDPALAAFLAAGGTLGDLCRDHGTAQHDDEPPCAACRPVTASLPPADQASPCLTLGAPITTLAWHRAAPAPTRPPLTRHSPRAPPAAPT